MVPRRPLEVPPPIPVLALGRGGPRLIVRCKAHRTTALNEDSMQMRRIVLTTVTALATVLTVAACASPTAPTSPTAMNSSSHVMTPSDGVLVGSGN